MDKKCVVVALIGKDGREYDSRPEWFEMGEDGIYRNANAITMRADIVNTWIGGIRIDDGDDRFFVSVGRHSLILTPEDRIVFSRGDLPMCDEEVARIINSF